MRRSRSKLWISGIISDRVFTLMCLEVDPDVSSEETNLSLFHKGEFCNTMGGRPDGIDTFADVRICGRLPVGKQILDGDA